MSPLSRFLFALLLVETASWLSISQARYGVRVEDMSAMTHYQSSLNADLSLGWLWSAARTTTDTHGLGQSITWAWDDALCDRLLPAFGKSSAFGFSLIDCDTLKSTMHRAFSTWSQNHPIISFTETTDLCRRINMLNEDCPHAEVWVTYRNATRDGSTGIAGAVQAAVALPTHAITNEFVFTNGKRHQLEVAPATATTAARNVPLLTIEIVGGRMEFAFEDPICWYIDSNFCNYFHRIKKNFNDPNAVHATGAVILFVLWGFAALAMLVEVMMAFRKQLKMKARVLVDRDGDGEVEAHEVAIQTIENAFLRVQAFLAAVAAESIIGTALRFTLLMIPWPFYIAIFQVCWDCYDFEAAAAHEIGHLLGIAHPDKQAGAELAPNYVATNGSFYNTYLAAGNQMNETHCPHPWNTVAAGTPPDFPADELTGSHGELVRPAIMESFTTHNPGVCLFPDDYEALVTLYPVCSGMPPTPRCEKADRNIGLLRVAIFFVGPLLVALFLSIFLHVFVERQIKHREKVKALRKKQLEIERLEKGGPENFNIGTLQSFRLGQSSTNIVSEAAMQQQLDEQHKKASAITPTKTKKSATVAPEPAASSSSQPAPKAKKVAL